MKAIVRNILLAGLISTFAFFGAIGRKQSKQTIQLNSVENKQHGVLITEAQKETFTCLAIALLTWVLCFWRCSVINRRKKAEREYQRRFSEYLRGSTFNRLNKQ